MTPAQRRLRALTRRRRDLEHEWHLAILDRLAEGASLRDVAAEADVSHMYIARLQRAAQLAADQHNPEEEQ